MRMTFWRVGAGGGTRGHGRRQSWGVAVVGVLVAALVGWVPVGAPVAHGAGDDASVIRAFIRQNLQYTRPVVVVRSVRWKGERVAGTVRVMDGKKEVTRLTVDTSGAWPTARLGRKYVRREATFTLRFSPADKAVPKGSKKVRFTPKLDGEFGWGQRLAYVANNDVVWCGDTFDRELDGMLVASEVPKYGLVGPLPDDPELLRAITSGELIVDTHLDPTPARLEKITERVRQRLARAFTGSEVKVGSRYGGSCDAQISISLDTDAVPLVDPLPVKVNGWVLVYIKEVAEGEWDKAQGVAMAAIRAIEGIQRIGVTMNITVKGSAFKGFLRPYTAGS